MRERFTFRRLVVQREVDGADGNTYRESLTPPVCDFCFGANPRWEYDCERFTLDGLTTGLFGSEGEWCACDRCSDLIEQKAWGRLHARSLLGMFTFNGKPCSLEQANDVKEIQLGFRRNYYPGRRAFG